MFYEYFLVDSTRLEGRKLYKIRFHPRSKANPVFDGEINIDSTSWALQSASMRIPRGLNLNWIRDLVIESEFQFLPEDSTWFPKRDMILADFSIVLKDSTKVESFMGSRQIDYSDIKINEPIPDEILAMNTNVSIPENVLHNDESYWARIRPYELSEREKNIYVMVDSVKKAPLFRNIYETINTVLFGYLKVGKLELGPYYRTYSFNNLEGSRFQLGIRTNKEFSEKIRLWAYGAYGIKDDAFKGGGSVEYMFGKQPLRKLTISAGHDVLQLGASRKGISASGNLFGSVLARAHNEMLTMIDNVEVSYQHEWTENITNLIGFEYREMQPTRYVEFVRPDGTPARRIKSTELRLGTRLSWNEIIIRRPFEKVAGASEYPVLTLDLAAGLPGVLGGDHEYYRAELTMDYSFNIAPLGRSSIRLSGGKIFGRVPFNLLKLHEGNSTYFYDRSAFSCMDFYEFASDMWVQGTWEHHFRGFFLDRIPLLKKLKWREVVTVKAAWGKLSGKNDGSWTRGHDGGNNGGNGSGANGGGGNINYGNAIYRFPEGMSSVSKPYVEAGVGIENIFRFFRVDAIWRLTHRNLSGRKVSEDRKTPNFAINASMHFRF